jgi:hypothetical protein
MNSRKLPVLATWLLKRLGIADRNPALAGDLQEEFQSGRSAAWYWRQAFMAIATDLRRNAWAERGYFGAFTIGYAAQACVAFMLWRSSWPPILHGIAFAILAIAMSIVLLGALGRTLRRRRYAKAPGSDLPQVENSIEFALFAVVAFGGYLVMDCLVALLWRQSLGEWAFTESVWFFGFILSDLTRSRRSRSHHPRS